jgi:hypothetical protein
VDGKKVTFLVVTNDAGAARRFTISASKLKAISLITAIVVVASPHSIVISRDTVSEL